MTTTFNQYTLEQSGVESVTFNLDETLVYAARRDGTIDVFDVASHAKVNSWQVGTKLGGMSLSEDGSFLLVTEDGTTTLHRVSTADGSVQNYTASTILRDVEVVDGNTAILTGNPEFLSGPPMLSFNIGSGAFSTLANARSQNSGDTVLVEDKHLTLIAEPGISNGPLFVYDDRTGTVVANGNNFQSPLVSGFNRGNQAISEAAGLIAQGIGSTINIYDLSLHAIQTVDFSPSAPTILNDLTDGLLFSDDGNYLYARSAGTGDLIKYDTHTWTIVDRYALGRVGYDQSSSAQLSRVGDQLHASSSGQYFTVVDSYSGNLLLVDLGNGTQGTAGPDTLNGTSGGDRLYGNGGNDILIGGTGDDILDGGDGNDIVVVGATRAATAITLLSQGNLVLNGPDGRDTLTSVETLRFSDQDVAVADLGIFGTAGDDTLTGTSAANIFYASTGNDSYDGGAGTDTVVYSGQRSNYTITVLPNGDIKILNKTDVLHDIEALRFSDQTVPVSSLVTIGTAGNDDLSLTDNNLTLLGLGGNDILRTGSFGGTLAGGAGDDTYYLDTSSIILEAPGEGIDTVITSRAFSLDQVLDNIEVIQITSDANFTLQAGANATRLVGNTFNNNLLGGAGDDVLVGGLGNDFLNGAGGIDTAIIHANRSAGALQLNLSQLQIVTAYDGALISNFARTITAVSADGTDTLVSVEKVQFDDTLFDTASLLHTGTVDADTLTGTSDGEAIFGQEGDDILTGGAGQDFLVGGPGRDIFRDTAAGLNGDHIYDLSAGDRISITDANLAGFSFALNGNTLTYTGGSLTLDRLPNGQLYTAAGASGCVDILVRATTIQNDFDGDGKSDILWRSSAQVGNWLALSNGNFSPNPTLYGAGSDWKIVGTGDFNGDGKSDLLWRNDDGRVGDWFGAFGGTFNPNATLTQVGNEWSVVGTGDFNGDGRADILWRNAGGSVGTWSADTNGNFTPNATLYGVDTSWKIAGTGDFNGDGRADILWRNTTTGQLGDWLANSDGTFSPNATLSSAPLNWHIAETGDFNGDGRADILWRNDAGQVGDWFADANGNFTPNATLSSAPLDWKIVEAGDYNGDGRTDILWRNTTTGQTGDWLADANGNFTPNATLYGAPLNWNVSTDHAFLV